MENVTTFLIMCYTSYTFLDMLYDLFYGIMCIFCTSVIFFPLIGFFCAAFCGNIIGTKGAQIITIFFLSLSNLISLLLFFFINLCEMTCQEILGTWFILDYLIINWQFLYDPLTCVMLIIINFISLCVHIYSIDYMQKDPHICRFMAYLSLFTFCMNLLVTAGNLIQLFIGWEGVGLCSYLLINFWYTRIQANKAALKALIINKIGDLAFLIALTLLGLFGYSLNFDILFLSLSFFEKINISFFYFNLKLLDFICFFLVIAAIGKSAQIGLHIWLPDAMEGPTPVSALIHAATMVTAGIFLLVRFSPLLEYSPRILILITIIGALTSFIAATIGLFQNDIKKIIAYSTCSQLGYMMFACGNSCYNIAMFHLFTHAFFKALLFLTAGAIIHSLNDEQDIRKYGGLAKVLPISFICILIGSLTLMGFPFLAGFYSKDLILETSYATYTISGHFAYWLGCFAAFCTSFYSIRLILLTFLIQTNSFKKVIETVHESSKFILIPLIFLSFCSIFVGFFFKEMFIGFGTPFWQNSIFYLENKKYLLTFEFLPIIFKLFPLFFSFCGCFIAIILFLSLYNTLYFFNLTQIGYNFYIFFNRKWFFDKIYTEFLILPFLKYSNIFLYELLDKGLFEFLGPYQISKFFNFQTKKILLIQSGFLYQYIYFFFFSFLIINSFLIFFFIYFLKFNIFYIKLNCILLLNFFFF